MQSSGLRHWIQQHVSWPLALALCLSLLLHVFLLNEVDWRNWFLNENPAPAVLQARLLPPPVQPVAVPLPLKKRTPTPAKPQPVQPDPAATQPPVYAAAAVEEPPTDTEAVDQTLEQQPGVSEELEQARRAEIAAWHEMNPPEPVPDDAPPPPYQHVSTDFSVFVNGEERPAGTAKIEYQREVSGNYHLRWVVEGRGLLELLYPSLVQQSQGEVSPSGLKPHIYRYAFGDRASKTYEATFDWAINIITLKTSKGEQRLDLRANTQDLLSFMYQFMFVPPLQEMHVTLTNGRRLGEYEYMFEGEDSVVIADKTVQTVHIAHTRGDTDEKVELWLASDYRYVPVKIKKLEKNGMVIEQVATRLIAE
jgi:hypothetical protein